MEAEDTASGPLRGISVTSDLAEAFTNSNFILMLDELRKNPNESSTNWKERKMQHFVDYGRVLNQVKSSIQFSHLQMRKLQRFYIIK